MSDINAALSVSTITLEWLKMAARNRVTEEFLQSVEASVVERHIWGELVVQLTAKVLAEQLPPERVAVEKTVTVIVPASPWQQFKVDHANAWWLHWLTHWRPPVMREHAQTGEFVVNLRRYWTYPEARVAAQMGRPIRVALVDQDFSWVGDES